MHAWTGEGSSWSKMGLPAYPAHRNPGRAGKMGRSYFFTTVKNYFFTTVIFAFGPLFARNAPSLPSMSAVRVPMRMRNISW